MRINAEHRLVVRGGWRIALVGGIVLISSGGSADAQCSRGGRGNAPTGGGGQAATAGFGGLTAMQQLAALSQLQTLQQGPAQTFRFGPREGDPGSPMGLFRPQQDSPGTWETATSTRRTPRSNRVVAAAQRRREAALRQRLDEHSDRSSALAAAGD